MAIDFPVTAEKKRELLERMQRLGIREEDIEERFVRAGGPGGQKVNKAATCVHLLHKPSGLQVKCQKSRSQALNRFLARRALVEMLEQKLLGEESLQAQEIARIRRQKRKRTKRAKEKMLAKKRREALGEERSTGPEKKEP